jgi:hypothetical protein
VAAERIIAWDALGTPVKLEGKAMQGVDFILKSKIALVAEELAGAALYFASAAGFYTTSAILAVDGGALA